MLLGQRDVQAIVRGGGLEFEIKAAAEALAQCQSPGLVDAAAKWSVDDKLHAATFIEKALSDDCALCRHVTQHRTPLQDVLNCLLGTGVVQSALLF